MVYQWNRDKAATNLRKHGVDFADAVSVFSDDLAIKYLDVIKIKIPNPVPPAQPAAQDLEGYA